MKSGEWVKQQQQYIKCRLISYQPIDGVGGDFLNKWSALYWLFDSTILISPQPSPAAHPQGSICNPMVEGEAGRRYFLQKNTKSRRNQCHALCPSLSYNRPVHPHKLSGRSAAFVKHGNWNFSCTGKRDERPGNLSRKLSYVVWRTNLLIKHISTCCVWASVFLLSVNLSNGGYVRLSLAISSRN